MLTPVIARPASEVTTVPETDIIGWILMISQFYFQCSGFVTGNKSCAARNISNILVETDSQNLGFLWYDQHYAFHLPEYGNRHVRFLESGEYMQMQYNIHLPHKHLQPFLHPEKLQVLHIYSFSAPLPRPFWLLFL